MLTTADAAYVSDVSTKVPANNPTDLAVIFIQNITNTNSKKYEA